MDREQSMISDLGIYRAAQAVRDDIYGDRVNVAARLERLCAAAEAYLLAVVHDLVEGKVAC